MLHNEIQMCILLLHMISMIRNFRLQLANGEFDGVDLICTRNRHDTVLFLIQKLEKFHSSFNPQHPPTKTMEELKLHINEEMKTPTFLEYLRLRSQTGIGDVKAMKVLKHRVNLMISLLSRYVNH